MFYFQRVGRPPSTRSGDDQDNGQERAMLNTPENDATVPDDAKRDPVNWIIAACAVFAVLFILLVLDDRFFGGVAYGTLSEYVAAKYAEDGMQGKVLRFIVRAAMKVISHL